MKASTILRVSILAAVLGGCATPPPPPPPPVDTSRTTVVLLPDEEGRVGAVTVTTAQGTQKVDQAYSYTTVLGSRSPSAIQEMGEEKVNAAYTEVIKSQPPKPISFTLYFHLDSAALTAESAATLPAVFEAVRERKPTEISIFGHTDAIGTDERNMKLSAERAKTVENLLRKRDPDLGSIEVKFFGSQEPLIPTPPRVPEPRNRRAEIMIL